MMYSHGYGGYEPEESIYALLPEQVIHEKKPPMHRSNHNGKIAPSYSTLCTGGTSKLQSNCHGEETTDSYAKKNAAGTMGRLGDHPDAKAFLKKKQGGGGGATSTKLDSLPPVHRHTSGGELKRSAVPKRTDKPVMGLMTQKDFVISNAVDNIMMEPKKPPPPPVRFTQTKGFGKTPDYLKRIKASVDREYSDAAHEHRGDGPSNGMRTMTEEERQSLIEQLTDKWDEAHRQYLRMTFSLDTRHKVLRKEAIEAELEQLEKAIAKLSKKLIYVFPDQRQYY